ncbi:phosphoribosylanthranilate isomerase [Oceanithermus sp.]
MTRPEDLRAAEELGVWAVGFVFASSKRQVSAERAAELGRVLGPFVTRVGVFVDSPPEEVLRVAETARLSAVQLHGNEPPEWAEKLSRWLPVIKAVRLQGPASPDWLDYPADALLVDGPVPGSGKPYDPGWLEPLWQHPRLIIAGGLTPERLPELFRYGCPYAVDVSSGVESAPGVKDAGRMAAFIQAARAACG